nr:tetratricopeptide repeat protein [Actinoallomurus rhizosphaericola]
MYFGRESESLELSRLWRSNRLTVLYGPTGVGRTSLLAAGVIPLLDTADADVFPVGGLLHGSAFPAATLFEHNPFTFALLSSWFPAESPTLLSGTTITAYLKRRPRRTDRRGRPLPLLASVDGLDELFGERAGQDRHREPFLRDLATALDEHPELRLLLSLREVHLAALSGWHPFRSAARFRLERLDREAATEAVRDPFASAYRFPEPELVDRVLAEVESEGPSYEPTLLQITCSRLWDDFPADSQNLTLNDVDPATTVNRALADFVASTLSEVASDHELRPAELATALHRAFADGATTARPPAIPAAALSALEDRHLIRTRVADHEFELLHPRLAALLAFATVSAPQDPEPVDAMRAAKKALANGEFALARRRAAATVRGIPETDLRLRAEAESLLGNIAYADGRPQEAERLYHAAMTLFEAMQDSTAVGQLLGAIGQVRLSQGRYADAVAELSAAVQRAPTDLFLKTWLAKALSQTGDRQAAISVLNWVLKADRDVPEALRTRGELLAVMGDAHGALHDLERSGELREPTVRAAHALALAMLSDAEAAREEIADVLAEVPANGPALFYAARIQLITGDRTGAVDLATRALAATAPPLMPHQREEADRLVSHNL